MWATINGRVRARTDNVKCFICTARDPKTLHINPLFFAKLKQVFLGSSSRDPPRHDLLRCLPLEVGRLEVLGVRLAAPSARPAAAASAAAPAALRLAAVDADEDEDEEGEDGGHEDDRDQGLLRHVICEEKCHTVMKHAGI